LTYCQISDVKPILQIDSADTSYDAELTVCVTSASALVDGLLKARDLAVPAVVPPLVADSAKYFAAWDFRRRRDPVGAEAFWIEANRLIDVYVGAEREPYVGST
jgi:hypothetical protein